MPCLSRRSREYWLTDPVAPGEPYSLFAGFVHLAAGLACGFTGLAAGYAIGIVGDAVSGAMFHSVAPYRSPSVLSWCRSPKTSTLLRHWPAMAMRHIS